jgi:hypothetical protein
VVAADLQIGLIHGFSRNLPAGLRLMIQPRMLTNCGPANTPAWTGKGVYLDYTGGT